ncbi:DHHC palmitoyltransferase-domain-containing protein [Gamsiella multidivaricata]|uniref:DHHC palmitoyltransferase-domain-containing protein n=1 Tax=Gamsiella multidivaricata TaxID=101098 RepID=UPI0022209542|nr:DHHC palmitoyltransferase-domain-containing protein [Gamsiella multidivaricata]KAI7832389.1 DHHC palmitoyltransferase-domain-containing protein [Gamsiella multidivaricata]
MGGNDRWIACLAWLIFAFISISSQVFIFWPWLFGPLPTSAPSLNSIESLDSITNAMDYDMKNSGEGLALGYLSTMWSNLNVQALLYLVPFNFSLVMLCWNYYLAMVTDPGSPPLNWNPPMDGSGVEYKRTTHTPRYCRTCDTYKPARTHHCRTCKRCILKMDHHCPWIRNCVGYFNYGHFVRFIIWTTISTFMCAALIILRCLEAYENEQLGINRQSAPTQEQILLIIVDLCLDGTVLFGISILATYHIWCISSNTTTIESWEKDRVLTMIRRGKIRDVKCPYHRGVLANFQEVLGKNPLLWLWPQPMLGDGLYFKVRRDNPSDLRDPSLSEEEDGMSSSSSRSPHSMLWARPYDGSNNPRDDEMV